MNSVIGICDMNTVYMKKLAESFMRKSDIPLQIMTFSDSSQLIQYLNEGSLDILVTGGEIFMDNLEQWQSVDAGVKNDRHKEVIQQKVRYTVILVDERGGIRDTDGVCFRVSRYQSSTELFGLIKQLITGGKTGYGATLEYSTEKDGSVRAFSGVKEKNEFGKIYGKSGTLENGFGCIIGVYSPINRCGKTSLAVLLSELLQKRSSSVLICMDHYSKLFSEEEWNLSELIYRMSRGNNLRLECDNMQEFSEYESYVKEWEELTYIPAPLAVEDLTQVSAPQLCRLLDMLKYKSRYHYIVMDLSEGIEDLHKVLEQCDFIFMPVLDDCISKCKEEEFNNHMKNMMEHEKWMGLSAKIHRLQLPQTFEAESPENYYRELVWSKLAGAAEELLEQYIV